MATEREIKEKQHERLFDIYELEEAKTEVEMRTILRRQKAKAQAVMTKEEIALVREEIKNMHQV